MKSVTENVAEARCDLAGVIERDAVGNELTQRHALALNRHGDRVIELRAALHEGCGTLEILRTMIDQLLKPSSREDLDQRHDTHWKEVCHVLELFLPCSPVAPQIVERGQATRPTATPLPGQGLHVEHLVDGIALSQLARPILGDRTLLD